MALRRNSPYCPFPQLDPAGVAQQGSRGSVGPAGPPGPPGPGFSGNGNLVLATPDGASGIASLRMLVAADLPSFIDGGTY